MIISLGSKTRERREQNLQDNDDNIYEHISILKDIDKSGLAHP